MYGSVHKSKHNYLVHVVSAQAHCKTLLSTVCRRHPDAYIARRYTNIKDLAGGNNFLSKHELK